MADLFASSFEVANFSDFTTVEGSPTSVTTPVIDGTRAMSCDAAPEDVLGVWATARPVALLEFYIRVAGTVTGESFIAELDSGSGAVAKCGMKLTTSRTLTLYDLNVADIGAASPVLATGAWYLVRLGVRVDATNANNGIVWAELNGVRFSYSTGVTVGTAWVNSVWLGTWAFAPGTSVVFDKMQVTGAEVKSLTATAESDDASTLTATTLTERRGDRAAFPAPRRQPAMAETAVGLLSNPYRREPV